MVINEAMTKTMKSNDICEAKPSQQKKTRSIWTSLLLTFLHTAKGYKSGIIIINTRKIFMVGNQDL